MLPLWAWVCYGGSDQSHIWSLWTLPWCVGSPALAPVLTPPHVSALPVLPGWHRVARCQHADDAIPCRDAADARRASGVCPWPPHGAVAGSDAEEAEAQLVAVHRGENPPRGADRGDHCLHRQEGSVHPEGLHHHLPGHVCDAQEGGKVCAPSRLVACVWWCCGADVVRGQFLGADGCCHALLQVCQRAHRRDVGSGSVLAGLPFILVATVPAPITGAIPLCRPSV